METSPERYLKLYLDIFLPENQHNQGLVYSKLIEDTWSMPPSDLQVLGLAIEPELLALLEG